MSWQRLIAPAVLLLAACASEPRKPAPIVDRTQSAPATQSAPIVDRNKSGTATVTPLGTDPRPGTYVVKKGDTLYRIALDHGFSYRELAAWNNLNDVNDIKVDQVLRLTSPDGASATAVETRPLKTDDSAAVPAVSPAPQAPLQYPKVVKLPYSAQNASSVARLSDGPDVAAKPQNDASKPVSRPTPAVASTSDVKSAKTDEKSSTKADSTATVDDAEVSDWVSPTVGKPLKAFTEETRGVDIPGKMGQPVLASANGKIVYAGAGLRGYGKMIIIKHNKEFLTAYAHNNKLLVKEGDSVKKGEKIAEMGNTDTDQVKLHFEIRRFGKPVDPAKFIPLEKP
ncbi:peptidoglycan DD-metalloendopeptidase family protein [Andreprevotia chitinilytica]|uniref:peptidoglycan DD-metalloendopeptidase family protein n=1 Tax=Andreprevotia chitinilytica TaxID=396808 RepID=UPI00054E915B|nr:peptidoglycan DD-metalloendopeptidase family protein [Andreprevotia chitinilytica]